jgi:hypothetical protein
MLVDGPVSACGGLEEAVVLTRGRRTRRPGEIDRAC